MWCKNFYIFIASDDIEDDGIKDEPEMEIDYQRTNFSKAKSIFERMGQKKSKSKKI